MLLIMFAHSFAPFTLGSYCTSTVSQVTMACTLGRWSGCRWNPLIHCCTAWHLAYVPPYLNPTVSKVFRVLRLTRHLVDLIWPCDLNSLPLCSLFVIWGLKQKDNDSTWGSHTALLVSGINWIKRTCPDCNAFFSCWTFWINRLQKDLDEIQ